MTKLRLSLLCVLASLAPMAGADEVDQAPAAPPQAAPRAKAPRAKAPAARPSAAAKGKAKVAKKAAPAAKPAAARKLAPPPRLPLATIVERNVRARGGLSAWRAVSSLTMAGQLEAGGTENAKLPFVMSMRRPHQSRLELQFQGQKAVQVWDGAQGWKVRPYLNRNEVEPFTAAEARSAAAAAELDGPLVDYAKKGTKVALAGTDVVEGRNAYELELTLKSGERRHLWIDAKTFLEVKIDGDPRRMDGRMHDVAVFYRDFKPVGGLLFPHTMETVVDKVPGSHKLSIQAIKVNPPLGDDLFAKPQLGKLAAR